MAKKSFYYLEFGSHDLVFGSFTETFTSRSKAEKALAEYAAKYKDPWGRVLRVTSVIAEIKRQVKLPKARSK